ncbi:gamma-glutamyl-gamma-aminobutyrate hydrolase family protein [Reinekea blandensis]|uniref:Glutamine amidotransferase class-I n=1 Tax=Reinekea blandensis MED297 TaxID=314283 RepID=A4BCV4_9GAMM|nr:gamma-glutamyl-gamma-aminobutyrate hydrolase family protein [Reinekea blandensis]EAR10036.1 Glutamine amidotransferase class-I [Reinekea sp. MED297] [Reinekea blandensis MED297]
MRPIIGITLDQEPAGGYAHTPWYALRENYADAIHDAGAIALALPAHLDSVERYLSVCDGLLITGGGFDIDPALYGANNTHPSVQLKPQRTAFEMALVQGALRDDKPVLGICGGEQLIAVVLGASLIQDIPESHPQALEHSPSGSLQNPNGYQQAHSVQIMPGTRLHQICQADEFGVNSSHHQSVSTERFPETLKINAVAPDGVIEGIESCGHRFCLGVQWHPEFQRIEADQRLFQAFIAACQTPNQR